MTHNPHTGSDFDDFLREEGLYEECNAIAIKRVLARQLAEVMKLTQIAKIGRVVSIMKTVQTIKMCVKDRALNDCSKSKLLKRLRNFCFVRRV